MERHTRVRTVALTVEYATAKIGILLRQACALITFHFENMVNRNVPVCEPTPPTFELRRMSVVFWTAAGEKRGLCFLVF